MAFPIVPVLLVGAGIYWLRSRRRAEPDTSSETAEFRRRRELVQMLGRKKGQKPPSVPPADSIATEPAPVGFDACRDAGISDEFADDLRAAYESTTLTPADFAEVVTLLDGYKFSKAAECFRRLLEKRKVEMTAQVKAAGGLPYTSQNGDTPSGVAQYYTSFPAKFRELGKLNEKVLGKLMTVGGVTNYPGWKAGAEILIPADWKPLEKPFKVQASA
jgi:hypothetical protein